MCDRRGYVSRYQETNPRIVSKLYQCCGVVGWVWRYDVIVEGTYGDDEAIDVGGRQEEEVHHVDGIGWGYR
jgi:hypothetical protein